MPCGLLSVPCEQSAIFAVRTERTAKIAEPYAKYRKEIWDITRLGSQYLDVISKYLLTRLAAGIDEPKNEHSERSNGELPCQPKIARHGQRSDGCDQQ